MKYSVTLLIFWKDRLLTWKFHQGQELANSTGDIDCGIFFVSSGIDFDTKFSDLEVDMVRNRDKVEST